MPATGSTTRFGTPNPTVRPGREPAWKMEKTIMFGVHPGIVFDLVSLAQAEQIERRNRAWMIAEASRGNHVNHGIVRSLRHCFGAAIISLGQRIHGERAVAAEPSGNTRGTTLGMAR